MLTDRCGLLLSTTLSAARDAYVEGCEALEGGAVWLRYRLQNG